MLGIESGIASLPIAENAGAEGPLRISEISDGRNDAQILSARPGAWFVVGGKENLEIIPFDHGGRIGERRGTVTETGRTQHQGFGVFETAGQNGGKPLQEGEEDGLGRWFFQSGFGTGLSKRMPEP